MCDRPSWIVDANGKAHWLLDKAVADSINGGIIDRENKQPMTWEQAGGHHAIEQILGVTGTRFEGRAGLPAEFARDIRAGRYTRLARSGADTAIKNIPDLLPPALQDELGIHRIETDGDHSISDGIWVATRGRLIISGGIGVAFDNATIQTISGGEGRAYDNATIQTISGGEGRAYDNATIQTISGGVGLACDNATIQTISGGEGVACGNATIQTISGGEGRAYDNATIQTISGGVGRAYDNATIKTVRGGVVWARGNATIHTVRGGVGVAFDNGKIINDLRERR